jgi:hypothetical protein
VDAAPEVAAERVAQEDAVLHGQRSVGAQLARHAGVLAARGVGRQQQWNGIAGEPHDHEHDGGDEPHRHQRPGEAGGEEDGGGAHR